MTCISKLLQKESVYIHTGDIGYYSIIKSTLKEKKMKAKKTTDLEEELKRRKETPYIRSRFPKGYNSWDKGFKTLYKSMFEVYQKVDFDIYEDSVRIHQKIHPNQIYEEEEEIFSDYDSADYDLEIPKRDIPEVNEEIEKLRLQEEKIIKEYQEAAEPLEEENSDD